MGLAGKLYCSRHKWQIERRDSVRNRPAGQIGEQSGYWDARLVNPKFSIRAEFMMSPTIPSALPKPKIGALATKPSSDGGAM